MKQFTKYNGLGNDYIVIDPQKNKQIINTTLVKKICHRNYGIGSDGILYGPTIDSNGKIDMTIYNPDGSIAERSGNGVRIFAQYLIDNKYITEKEDFFSFTVSGEEVQINVIDRIKKILKVEIATYSFKPNKIGIEYGMNEFIDQELQILDRTFKINCVSIGNPHCVIFVNENELSKDMACKYGKHIECHPIFKNKINVQFACVKSRNEIDIQIWERGAGYTLASGTSSCGVACVAYHLKLVDEKIAINCPGGTIAIEIDSKKEKVSLTADTEILAQGEYFF